MTPKFASIAWRNRIAGHADVPPDQLLANPANWRTHPREQQRSLDGHVVGGHLRVELAISRNEQPLVLRSSILSRRWRLPRRTHSRPLWRPSRAHLGVGVRALGHRADEIARSGRIVRPWA